MAVIDISHCDKAAVLAALYNRARVQGMGFLSARPVDMQVEEARAMLAKSERFDYVHGRVLKVDLDGATLDPRLYDRDNGAGAALGALQAAGLV